MISAVKTEHVRMPLESQHLSVQICPAGVLPALPVQHSDLRAALQDGVHILMGAEGFEQFPSVEGELSIAQHIPASFGRVSSRRASVQPEYLA